MFHKTYHYICTIDYQNYLSEGNKEQKKRFIALWSVLAGIAYIYLTSVDYINHRDAFANSFLVPGGFFMGLIALLIAHMLKRSVKLNEESDLTI